MIIALLDKVDKEENSCFFLANFSISVILETLFFILSNLKIKIFKAKDFLKNLYFHTSYFNHLII